MGRKLSFTVPGVPKGKARPRFDPRSGRAFSSKETVAEERAIATIFKLKFPHHQPFTGAVMMRFTAVFPIPKGFSAAQRAAALEGTLLHTSTPDKDNVEKQIADAINGLAWVDDSQVMGGGMKRYGEVPRIDVTLEELDTVVASPAEKRRRTKLVRQPELALEKYRRGKPRRA